ncbi:MAG: hypothetical protein WDW38_003717 [Sanguina aurantia]
MHSNQHLSLRAQQTALRLATYVTLPCVIIRALSTSQTLTLGSSTVLMVAGISFATVAAANWLYCLNRTKRERAVLTGCGLGLSLPMFGYPFVGAVFGPAGLQPLVLLDLMNSIAVTVGSYLLFATAGPAFPDAYPHTDGGTFRGQWRGMVKEGLGVYSYASEARYAGEWRGNVKDGRGVYEYPKGGMYEGEWSNGSMNGIGVRTFATGQVKSGRWSNGQLTEPLELWQCANAVEGAAEAALAARRVEVGGGQASDGLQQLLLQPPLWAGALGLILNLSRTLLPASLDTTTALLAQGNSPLLLLAAGLTAPTFQLPAPKEAADVARVVATRTLVPLLIGASLLAAVGGGFPGPILPIAVALLAFLSPVPPNAMHYTRQFRLNEALTTAITSASYAASLPLLCLFGLAAAASGIAPDWTALAHAHAATSATAAAAADVLHMSAATQAAAAAAGAGSAAAAAAAAAAGAAAQQASPAALAGFCMMVTAVLASALAHLDRSSSAKVSPGFSTSNMVKMVYAGPPGSSTNPGSDSSARTTSTASGSTSSSSNPAPDSTSSGTGSSSSSSTTQPSRSGGESEGGGGSPPPPSPSAISAMQRPGGQHHSQSRSTSNTGRVGRPTSHLQRSTAPTAHGALTSCEIQSRGMFSCGTSVVGSRCSGQRASAGVVAHAVGRSGSAWEGTDSSTRECSCAVDGGLSCNRSWFQLQLLRGVSCTLQEDPKAQCAVPCMRLLPAPLQADPRLPYHGTCSGSSSSSSSQSSQNYSHGQESGTKSSHHNISSRANIGSGGGSSGGSGGSSTGARHLHSTHHQASELRQGGFMRGNGSSKSYVSSNSLSVSPFMGMARKLAVVSLPGPLIARKSPLSCAAGRCIRI